MTQSALDDRAASTAAVNPYVGLDFFTEAKAHVFFGRDAERRIIIANLQASRLTLLYAESGVGKSSLLRAGVAARLRELARPDAPLRSTRRAIPVVFSSWKDDPVADLIAEVAQTVGSDHLPGTGLHEALASATEAADATILLILDQFEDFFLGQPADRFAEQLARCIADPDLQVNVLISIREDMYSRVGDLFKGLIPNVYGNFLHLDYLDERAARDAIQGPISRLNETLEAGAQISVEAELVDAVLVGVRRGRVVFGDANGVTDGVRDDAVRPRIETAYLQLVMDRLWDEESLRGSRRLRLSTLTELGGADAIVRDHLRAALEDFTSDELDAAALSFRFLVTSGGGKHALTSAEIAEYAEATVPVALLEKVLDHLERRRIVREVTPDSATEGNGSAAASSMRYEIFHDVLGPAVVEWRRAHDDDERQKELVRQRALALRARAQALVFALVAVVAVVAAGIAAVLWLQAAGESKVKHSQRLADEALATLPTDPAAAVQDALDALAIRHTSAAENALRLTYPDFLERRVLKGHTDIVRTAAYSPDGKYVASGSEDHTVRIWNVAGGKLYRPPLRAQSPDEFLWHVAFSHDGRYLLSAGTDGMVRVWDWRNRARSQPVVTLLALAKNGDPVPLRSAEFSWDGRYIAAVGDDPVTRVWDWRRDPARPRFQLRDPDGTANLAALAFDRRGDLLTGGSAYVARLWRLGANRPSKTLAYHADELTTVAITPNGRYAATGSKDKEVCVWDLSESSPGCSWSWKLSGNVDSVAFSPDGNYVAAAADDGGLAVWDWRAQELLIELRGHADAVNDVEFNHSGARLVTASSDQTVRIWDTSALTIPGLHESYYVTSVAFDPTGKRVAFSVRDDASTVWSWRLGSRRVSSTGKVWPNASTISPDGKELLAAGDTGQGNDDTATIWRIVGDRLVLKHSLSGGDPHTDSVVRAQFSRDGKRIVTASYDKTAKIWDADRGTLLKTLKGHKDLVYSAAFSPDGLRVVTASDDGTVRIWNAGTGRLLRKLSVQGVPGVVRGAEFSPDGREIVTAHSDKIARVWKAGTGELVGSLVGHAGPIESAKFSPNGRWIVTASADGTIRIWDARQLSLLAVIREHAGPVNDAVISPDGRWVASGSDDYTVKVYRCGECVPLVRLEASARRLEQNLGSTR